jgi:hypothetical protein
MTKLCKDCKHFRKEGPHWMLLLIPVVGWIVWVISYFSEFGIKYAKCYRPKGQVEDLVGGRPEADYHHSFCSIERSFSCGVSAQYYEPKKLRAAHLKDKEIVDEIRRRGLYKLMKDYKREADE